MPGYILQRIRKDLSTTRFFMSIDYTNRTNGEVVCEKGANSQLSNANPVTQPDLVDLDFLALEFMRKSRVMLSSAVVSSAQISYAQMLSC